MKKLNILSIVLVLMMFCSSQMFAQNGKGKDKAKHHIGKGKDKVKKVKSEIESQDDLDEVSSEVEDQIGKGKDKSKRIVEKEKIN